MTRIYTFKPLKKNFFYFTSSVVFLLFSCGKDIDPVIDDGLLSVNFIQINDVYEIAPLGGGKEGGMARVAELKQQYLNKNKNTFLFVAGDFLSPSIYNTLKYQGKYVRGKQMVDVMNVAGVDFAIFGNHEFDLNEEDLQQRINESKFQWIASNVFKNNSLGGYNSFEINTSSGSTSTIPQTFVMTVTDADGTTAKIGFIALTIPENKASYVYYEDTLNTAKKLYEDLKNSVDVVVAITHQSIEQDRVLAKAIPNLAMIMGGHEHDQHHEMIGNVCLTKAFANAKSAYVLTLTIDKKTNTFKVIPKVENIDSNIPLNANTNEVVQKWLSIVGDNLSTIGFNANNIIVKEGEPFDGRETEVRSRSTNLTKLIVSAMQKVAPEAVVALLNSGSIRVDDLLYPPVTEYDIVRTLPFGGGIQEVDMKGVLLIKILDIGKSNIGNGGFLQYNPEVRFDDMLKQWLLNNVPIDISKIYRVVLADFLLTGKEANLSFLTTKNENITKVYDYQKMPEQSDIRKAVIAKCLE